MTKTQNGKEQSSQLICVPGFFVFEGIDGAGKTTLVARVHKMLEEHYPQLRTVCTKEPDGAPYFEFSKTIRSLVTGEYKPNPYTQALLMFAARYENCINFIVPHLNDNCLILCDRWMDSSYAYQGIAGGVDFDFIKVLSSRFPSIARTLNAQEPGTGQMFSSHMAKLTYPDKIFILDIDPKVAAGRIKSRAGKTDDDAFDSLEQQYLSKMALMRYHYLGRVASYPDQYVVLDATDTTESLAHQVCEVILNFVRSASDKHSDMDN